MKTLKLQFLQNQIILYFWNIDWEQVFYFSIRISVDRSFICQFRIIQMQDIIREVEFLSKDLQIENARMLQLLQQLMAPAANQVGSYQQRQSINKQSRARSIRSKQKESLNDESILHASRQSFETIKNQSIKRCESCESIKNSRQTEKTLSKNKKRVGEIRHESNMARLSKISQKMVPRVKGELLVKKKSKIFHFETRY